MCLHIPNTSSPIRDFQIPVKAKAKAKAKGGRESSCVDYPRCGQHGHSAQVYTRGKSIGEVGSFVLVRSYDTPLLTLKLRSLGNE